MATTTGSVLPTPSLQRTYADTFSILVAEETGALYPRSDLYQQSIHFQLNNMANNIFLRRLQRRETTVLRIVRDTRQARQIKELYDYRCQMCGMRLVGLSGPYAEAAHIRPFGAPHHGPDTPDNILCLCPNHHVLFDHGGVGSGEDRSLVGEERKLEVDPQHRVSEEHLRYRREHYQTKVQSKAAQRPILTSRLHARSSPASMASSTQRADASDTQTPDTTSRAGDVMARPTS
jgi:hypothetical protein